MGNRGQYYIGSAATTLPEPFDRERVLRMKNTNIFSYIGITVSYSFVAQLIAFKVHASANIF